MMKLPAWTNSTIHLEVLSPSVNTSHAKGRLGMDNERLIPLLWLLTGCAVSTGFPGYVEGTDHPDAAMVMTDARVALSTDAHVADGHSVQPSTDGGTPPMHDTGVSRDAATGLDATSNADALIVDIGDAYNTAPVCTSGMTWTLGNTKSALMNPGLGCDTCHVLGGSASGYEFDLAGTVYPTAHEPDLCDGVAGATIVVTDANNAEHTLTINAAGNFYNFDYLGVGAIPTPYKAKVVFNGQERPMLTPQTNGDCNSCHTEQGTQNAPGRVMMP
jgi:hypothetical protein